MIAHHLRHVEEGSLKRGGATGDKGCTGMRQQRIGLILDNMKGLAHLTCARNERQHLLVEIIIDAWSCSEHQLIVREPRCHTNHGGQVALNLLTTRASQQSDDGTIQV